MSAFGQAGFGSRNRRNQLQAQGQMDPYGQQVRAAKQAPTFNVYQTQGTQQATGQQRAPSQSQPAQQPVAAQPSAPAMPAYSQTAVPSAGSAQGSPGAAQPIQPQSQGTPYGADPGYADRVAAAAQQWSSTPAGSQQIGNWQNNPSSVARERQQERATREAEMAAQGRASERLDQQANATDRMYVQTGFAQRQFERDGQNVTEPVPSYGIGGLGTEHLPRYRRLPDGTMQPVDQADRAPVGGWGAPGQAQPIQPQSQGTPYQSQPMVNDRPMRSIEDDMAADRELERQNGWWAQESARRGIDQSTGAPLAGRTNEQAAYADFVSRPQPIGPEPPQFNFDTSRLQAQQDQLMQQSNAAVYKALRRDSSQGNQSPMVSGANARLRRMLSQNMMLDTWRKKQQAGG